MLRAIGFFVLLAGMALPPFGHAQAVHAEPLSVSCEGKVLAAALRSLDRSPSDPTAQKRFLDAFPKDYKRFMHLFGTGRPLYDGHDYVDQLSSLAKVAGERERVGGVLLQLCASAPVSQYLADAPNYLQNATIVFADRFTKDFAAMLKALRPAERSQAIRFLAVAQNFCYYPKYQDAIDRLRQAGKTRLAAEFEQARRRQGGPCSGGPLDPLLRHGKQSPKRGRGEDGN